MMLSLVLLLLPLCQSVFQYVFVQLPLIHKFYILAKAFVTFFYTTIMKDI